MKSLWSSIFSKVSFSMFLSLGGAALTDFNGGSRGLYLSVMIWASYSLKACGSFIEIENMNVAPLSTPSEKTWISPPLD